MTRLPQGSMMIWLKSISGDANTYMYHVLSVPEMARHCLIWKYGSREEGGDLEWLGFHACFDTNTYLMLKLRSVVSNKENRIACIPRSECSDYERRKMRCQSLGSGSLKDQKKEDQGMFPTAGDPGTQP